MEKNESIKKSYELVGLYQPLCDEIRDDVTISDIYDVIMNSTGDPYDKICDLRSKAGMPIPYRDGMKASFSLLVSNIFFYCLFRDMPNALAIIRT